MSTHNIIDDIFKNQKRRFQLSDNAKIVLEHRYLKKDKKGAACEMPDELFRRVADCVSQGEDLNPKFDVEKKEHLAGQFYQLMRTGVFMPNSPTLMNAGRSMGMLSACFVLPVEDSIDGIFTAIKNTALIQKAGGGTGFSFSRLRPKGDRVQSSGGTTSGPLSFLKVFSEATNAIQQGAFRRGANMGVMDITHPDILEFITVKENQKELTNFNLSVGISDAFMEKLKNQPNIPHEVINPRTGETKFISKQDAPETFWSVEEVMNLIIQKSWESGEPGVLFMDHINRANPTPHIGAIEATNPCGEQPLLGYEACNLGSIDVSKFFDKKTQSVLYDSLTQTVYLAVRFLDNVIDVNRYPIPQIEEMCKKNRKIGLGIMGFADLLYQMDVSYDSEEALQVAEDVMRCIQDESHKASHALAEEKGVFPNWKGSVWDKHNGVPMRNAATTTIAPTGTISIISDCSCGIEPLFSLAFYRNILGGQKMMEVNKVFREKIKKQNLCSEALLSEIIKTGSIQEMKGLSKELRYVFKTAHDICPEWHIRMQAAFQKYCDSSISKTINFKHDSTQEDIKEIFKKAYEYNLKGVTIYRDGCRSHQPMALEPEDHKKGEPISPADIKPVPVPEMMPCIRIRQSTPFGNMHVKICVEPASGLEREVFAQLGKGGDVANSDLEAICRLLSLYLRSRGSLDTAIAQLEGIGSSLSIPTRDGRVMSLADGLAKAVRKYQDAKNQFGIESLLLGKMDVPEFLSGRRKNNNKKEHHGFKIKCPECSGNLAYEEGCVMCHQCGYTKC
ncbi:vitamin B12-dependent ribonucleotide reductase [PVC group bacterium]|nr:vitamin B12-dependent ribonucleotide reductase [PVC group bacterium]